MRIPVLDGPQVSSRPVGTPYGGGDQHAGGEVVAQGLAQLGEGLGRAAQKIEEVRKRADAVAVNDLLTAYQSDVISALDGSGEQPGFMSTKGVEAQAKRADLLAGLEKRGGQLEESLSGDDQKKLFRQHAQKIYLGGRTRVESHVQQQRRTAEIASLDARAATSLTAIANSYADDAQVADTSKAVEQTIRAFEAPMGAAVADAKVAEWRSKVAQTRLNQFLAAKDWQGAQAVFAQAKGDLGPAAAQYQKAIDGTKRDSAADGMAQQLAREFTGKDGRVDVTAALAKLDETGGTDTALKDEARHRLEARVVEMDKAWKQDTEKVSDAAFGAYNTGGWPAIPWALKQELNSRNPDLYHRLEKESEMKLRGSRSDQAAARREQAERNKEALNNFLTLPASERATVKVDEWAMGRGLDPLGLSDIKRHQRGSIEVVDKGLSVNSDKFVGQAMAAGQGVAKSKKAKEQLKAEATLEFQRFIDQNKRPPSVDEALELTSKLVENTLEPGWLWGTNEVPEYERRAHERANGVIDPATPARPPGQPVPPGTTLETPPKAPVGERYQQLKREGKSPKEIAETLNAEGYRKGGP